jgi:phosphatidylinositol-3-phosphatase
MRIFVSAITLVFLVAACGGGSSAPSSPAASSAAPTPSSAGSSATGGAATTGSSPGASTSAHAGSAASQSATTGVVPAFDHIVVVVEENRASGEVLGNPNAPFMNALTRSGLRLMNSYGIRHPSQPNYLTLFSGATHGVTSDACPLTFRGDNLAHQLLSRGQTFAGYSQTLPRTGYTGCTWANRYARKHAPWADFTNVPASANRMMSAFPRDYSKLPRVSFVVPDLQYDMHDGTVAQADAWLRSHLGGYISWARTHNSLFVLTWDEDDRSAGNNIPGVLVGDHVPHARYWKRVDHYTMLRTIEAACGLPALGHAAERAPIAAAWTP